MPRPFLSGLRGRLLILVLLAVLPAFALTFYAGWRDRQHQLGGVAESTLLLARSVASDQERIIDGTRQILSDLAQVPEVRAGDAAKSRTFFRLLMKQYRGYASFTVVDLAGNVLVSLPSSGEQLNFSDRSWFGRAVAEKSFAVGDYQIGQLTRRPVLVAAWPVLDEGLAVTSVITAALDVEWLNNQVAATSRLPAGAVLVLLDRQERIVARYPDAPQWIGRTMPEAGLLSETRATSEGVVEIEASDGVARIYGFTPIRGRVDTGLRIVIGVPRDEAYAAINRMENRQLVALVLVAGLTLIAAWVGAERFVLRRVASLLEATQKLAGGDPAARTRLPYGHGELSDLARAFDEMAGAIQARQSERDRAEQALRESEERFRAFMNHSPAVAFVKDEAGHYLYGNAAFERSLGLEHDAWFGTTDEAHWASETAQRFREMDVRVLETGEPQQVVETNVRPDGHVRHWLTVKFPLTDGGGRRLLAGTCVDLTEWRLAQEALGRSERRYQQLVEQASDGIILTDEGRQIIDVNSAACAMSGYSREQMLGLHIEDLWGPDARAALARDLEALPPGRDILVEGEFRRRDGGVVAAEISAKRLEHGAVQAFVRDVTARQLAEDALRASEDRFRRLYHYLPLAYQSLTPDGAIVEVNEAWVRLAGLRREDAVGRRFADMLPQDSRALWEESLAALTASREMHDVEFTLVREGRAAVIVAVDGRLGQDERGGPRIHCVLHDVTAARVSEVRLRQSEERYRTLFAESPISLWEEDFSGIKRHIDRLRALGVTDLEAHFAAHPEELADCVETVRVVDVNKATLALYGAESRSQLLAGLDRIIGMDGHEVFKDAILALARGERSWESEGVNYTLVGDPIRLALRWSLAPGAGRTWSRVLVSALDVSESRRAEAALRESELRLERTFRSAPGIMAISTLTEGRYVEVNDAFVTELGFSRQDVVGRTAAELGTWADPEQRAGLVREVRNTGAARNREIRLRRRSGALIEGLCSAVPLVIDGEECLLVHTVDITPRKRSEDAGRESQRMLATLMSNLPGMVYQCCEDPEWTMLFVSEGCRELTGYEPTDLVGNRVRSYGSLIVPEDRDLVMDAVRQAVVHGCPFRMTYRIRTADGVTKWVSEQGRAVTSAGGQVTLEGFVSDITDRRRAEDELKESGEQLRQAQKMEAVGRLAGGIAHDFNNLLTAILGYSDLILAHLAPEDPLTPRVVEIHKAGERATNLTRQLLAFSRKQVLEPEVLALEALLADMAPMLRPLIGEDVEVRVVASSPVRIKADRTQMEQVVLNLVVNARDAMPRGGTITLEASRVRLDERDVRDRPGAQPGGYALLAISDTGAGMSEEVRSHLFEPFFTTKGKGQGTGLGLSTVYGIIQQSGGFVLVDSEVGQGTRFRIYLPLVQGDEASAADGDAAPGSVAGTERVLLVEDEDAVRRLIRSILERHGYEVIEAANGEQGLAVWEEAGQSAALVITDVVMPKVDGLSLVSRIRAIRPGTRAIFVSGYNDEAISRHGRLLPDVPLLQKPFSSAVLMRTVRQLLDAPPSPTPAEADPGR